eukprot:gene14042-15511_t
MERKLVFQDIEEDREISILVKNIVADELSSASPNVGTVGDASLIVKLSVPKIFESFIKVWDDILIDSLVFLIDGKFVPITTECFEVDVLKTRVIYLVNLTPQFYRQLGRLELSLDETSFNEWMNNLSHEELRHHRYTLSLLSALHATLPTTSSPEIIAPANNNNNRNQAGLLDPLVNVLHFLQWRLLIRMVVLYFIFFHHRGMKDEKKYAIIMLMAVAYLFQTGILAIIANRIRTLLGIQGGVGNPQNNHDNNPNNPNNPRHRLHDIANLFVEGVNIPRRPGFLYDVASIFIGFFASLFPAWEVRAEPLPAVETPTPLAQNAENENRENNHDERAQQPPQPRHVEHDDH